MAQVGAFERGCGPAADAAGNIYLESGNGNFDGPNNVLGDTVIKLSTTNGLAVADYFTPYNELDLNLRDIDIGSAGQIVLPDSVGSVAHPHLLIAGSKAGHFMFWTAITWAISTWAAIPKSSKPSAGWRLLEHPGLF